MATATPERRGPPPIPEAARRKKPELRIVEQEPSLEQLIEQSKAALDAAGDPESIETQDRAAIERITGSIKLAPEHAAAVEKKVGFFARAKEVLGRMVIVREKGKEALEGKEFRITASPVETEASLEHPDRNEDAAFVDAESGVAAVFDGVGGAPAGDRASAEALLALKENLDLLPSGGSQAEMEAAMDRLLRAMSSKVAEVGKSPEVQPILAEYLKDNGISKDDRRFEKMLELVGGTIGTTAEVVKLWKDKKGKSKITVGGAGDSRVYRMRGGKLEQISRDDSPLAKLIEAGVVKNDQDVDAEIPASAIIGMAEKDPVLAPVAMKLVGEKTTTVGKIRNMVSQALGPEALFKQLGTEFKPNIETFDAETGDEYLLLSDGVTDNLLDSEIEAAALRLPGQPEKIAAELKRMALEVTKERQQAEKQNREPKNKRAKFDDITAVALKI